MLRVTFQVNVSNLSKSRHYQDSFNRNFQCISISLPFKFYHASPQAVSFHLSFPQHQSFQLLPHQIPLIYIHEFIFIIFSQSRHLRFLPCEICLAHFRSRARQLSCFFVFPNALWMKYWYIGTSIGASFNLPRLQISLILNIPAGRPSSERSVS